MQLGKIPDADGLFRLAVAPPAFVGKAFSSQKFLFLKETKPGQVIGSFAWERFVPATKYVHAYGCRMSFARNDAARRQGRYKEKSRQVYCGAYYLTADDIRKLAETEGLEEIVSAEIYHLVEGGELSHAELRVEFAIDGQDPEATKTAIADRLWMSCSGPIEHICECDADVLKHPSELLDRGPAGIYIDVRAAFQRYTQKLIFSFCDPLWRLWKYGKFAILKMAINRPPSVGK